MGRSKERAMEFGVLGPLTVTDDGGRAVLARMSKQRILLALLLCDVGSTVSTSRMIEVIWHGTPPPSPHRALQVYLHRLRSALGPFGRDRIVHRPPGYRLTVLPDELDEHRFLGMTARARLSYESGDQPLVRQVFDRDRL
jgi:DNA-binding SARP family transcriptional activator